MKKKVRCPFCKKEIEIGIKISVLKTLSPNQFLHCPHINIHGNPLHALICYFNTELYIRNVGVIKSIEFSRDSETFKEMLKNWTNPY